MVRPFLFLIILIGLALMPALSAQDNQPPMPGYANQCPPVLPIGYLPSRLTGGMTARVVPGGTANNVRDDAMLSANMMTQVQPDQTIYVTSSPACNDGIVWWQVVFGPGENDFGWMAEGQNGEYFMEPVWPQYLAVLGSEPITMSTVSRTGSATAVNSLGSSLGVFWSPDSRYMAVNTVGGVWLFDVRVTGSTPRLIQPTGVASNDVTNIVFSADSQVMTTLGREYKRYDTATGELLNMIPVTISEQDYAGTMALALSPDGTRLATTDSRANVNLWDANSGQQIASLPAHTLVGGLVFSPDGQILVSIGAPGMMLEDKSVRLWNVVSPSSHGTFEMPGFPTRARFSPDGSFMYVSVNIFDQNAGTAIEQIHRIDIVNSTGLSPLPALPANTYYNDFVISPDGTIIAAWTTRFGDMGVSNTALTFLDAASGQEIWRAETGTISASGMAFSPDGTVLAVVYPQGFPQTAMPVDVWTVVR